MQKFKSVMKMSVPGFMAWVIVMSFFSGSMSLSTQSAQVINSISSTATESLATTQMSLAQLIDLMVSAGVITAEKAGDARL